MNEAPAETRASSAPRRATSRWFRHVPNAEPGRLSELDGLRGLAVLAVLIYHLRTSALPFGWVSVDLFFVLSAYLITSIILRQGDAPRFLAAFYARRALKIWPIYFLTLLVLALANPWLPRPCRWAGLPWALTYTQNVAAYWGGTQPAFSPYLVHSWTLAIEEQFYLLWPALVLLVGRRRVAPLAIAVGTASVLARAQGLHGWALGARADGLALGGLLACLLIEGKPGKRLRLRRAFRGVAIAALVYLVPITATGGLPKFGAPAWPGLTVLVVNLLWFAVVGLAVIEAGGPSLRFLRSRTLVGLGTISYGIYLYHLPVLLLTDDIGRHFGGTGRPYAFDALAVAACLGLAALSWRLIERPILAFKERFPYRKTVAPKRDAPMANRDEIALRGDPERTMN